MLMAVVDATELVVLVDVPVEVLPEDDEVPVPVEPDVVEPEPVVDPEVVLPDVVLPLVVLPEVVPLDDVPPEEELEDVSEPVVVVVEPPPPPPPHAARVAEHKVTSAIRDRLNVEMDGISTLTG